MELSVGWLFLGGKPSSRHGNSKPFIGCTIGLSTVEISCISHELVCFQFDPTEHFCYLIGMDSTGL